MPESRKHPFPACFTGLGTYCWVIERGFAQLHGFIPLTCSIRAEKA